MPVWFKQKAEKERISFLSKPNAHYFGVFEENTLIGCTCIIQYKNGNGKIKSSYILDEYRNKGIFTELNKISLEFAKELGIKQLKLNCTDCSVNIHLKAGAVIERRDKTITYMRYDENALYHKGNV